ncbi:lysozyme inhibitor LprI family protein [Pseudogemmobacter bohemicus]|uniref:lysozyme inhibitor LprI family protein n=1 Tax=Pseudogemmobacter bohemicus TaxID=2250708 RepID=UPI0013005DEC|nr:lysozyme inhibitor LprI family protein [Pseudogemmobacter bohemicus]
MKALLTILLLLAPALLIPASAARSEISEAWYREVIRASGCETGAAEAAGACIVSQINACRETLMQTEPEAGYFLSHGCAHEAFTQADRLLNQFYKTVLVRTKQIEAEFAGSAYQGQEALLRKSQRAWLEVRDSTCELNVSYGALMSGSSATISECKARLTMQRIGDLRTEIGHYLQ